VVKMVIDRFEGDVADLEYERKTYDFPKKLLPSGAKEGDVLEVTIRIDKEETERHRKEIQNLMDNLFE